MPDPGPAPASPLPSTPRGRMLAAYRGGRPDRVPVSPELWDATAITVSGRPYHELIGPFAQVPWWRTHLAAFARFGADAWIVPGPGESAAQRGMRASRSRFLDAGTIETETAYDTPHGRLHAVARTTPVYADWLLRHPVGDFAADMPAYADYFFAGGEEPDLAEIREATAGVGEQGLVTPYVGELFTSFLAAVREGGMAQTALDLQDHAAAIEALHGQYVEFMAGRARQILSGTPAQALFVNSNYAGPPIVSPRLYRRWDAPVLAAVAAVCREFDAPLHLHQHGHTAILLEDLVAAGVSLVCPLLPPPQGDVGDLAALKRAAAGRIALKGNVDPFLLLNGTPQDVTAAVQACLAAGAPGGGFILGTADSTLTGTPFENIEAFVEAGVRWG